MGLGMRLVTAAGPFYTKLDQDGLCTEVGKYRDWPRKKSSEEVPKYVSPDKRCRGVDFVGSFPSSKRIQRAFVPQAQDYNQRNENFHETDKCFSNVNAA
jgi:hypothetical protein